MKLHKTVKIPRRIQDAVINYASLNNMQVGIAIIKTLETSLIDDYQDHNRAQEIYNWLGFSNHSYHLIALANWLLDCETGLTSDPKDVQGNQRFYYNGYTLEK